MESVRMLRHYFHTSPGLSFRAFVVAPLRGLLLCSWRGHRQSGVTRMLGLCNHCLRDV